MARRLRVRRPPRFLTRHPRRNILGNLLIEALNELQTKCASDVAHVLSGEMPVYPVKEGTGIDIPKISLLATLEIR